MIYNFDYKVTKEDYLKFNEYHITRSNQKKNKGISPITTFVLTLCSLAALATVGVLGVSLFYGTTLTFAVILAALVVLGNLFLAIFIIAFVIYIILRILKAILGESVGIKAHRFFNRFLINILGGSSRLPFNESGSISFYDDYFVDVAEGTEIKVYYNSLISVESVDGYLYVYINAGSAIILPKNIFAGEKEIEDLLHFIEDRRNAPVLDVDTASGAEPRYSLRYLFNRDDYVNFSLPIALESNRNMMRKPKTFILLKVLPTVFVVSILLFIALNIVDVLGVVSLVIPIGMFVYFIWAGFLGTKKKIAKIVNHQIAALISSGEMPHLDTEIVLDFYEEYLVETLLSSSSTVRYTAIESLSVDVNKAYYLRLNLMAAHIVPFHAFSDNGDRLEFESFIKEKVLSR